MTPQDALETALATLERDSLRELMERALRSAGQLPSPLPPDAEKATLVLAPREDDLTAKDIPVDTLLHKITMIRDRLRVSEQRINASDTDPRQTLELQQSITELYRVLSGISALLSAPKDPTP